MSSRVQGWLICDGDSILVRDGYYKSKFGESNRPENPLPPPSQCVRVEIEVATRGADPNPRVAAIHAYELDDKHERTNRQARLTGRQKQLLKQYIDSKIPPYMLKMGGDAVVQAFLGPEQLQPSPRPRKQNRREDPNERALRFACKVCSREDAMATVGGITLRSTIGFRCRDCGAMICSACQKTKIKESAVKAGFAGTVIEDLGKQYSYEDWYGEECQYCSTGYEMQWVFANVVTGH